MPAEKAGLSYAQMSAAENADVVPFGFAAN